MAVKRRRKKGRRKQLLKRKSKTLGITVSKKNIPTLKVVTCPDCSKKRRTALTKREFLKRPCPHCAKRKVKEDIKNGDFVPTYV